MGGRNLTGYPSSAAQKLFASSSRQRHQLGEKQVTADGRKFRYVKAGASDLVVGDMIQAPAEVANHDQLTPSAAAVGDTEITVTLGATAATANQYADGWACIDTTPGLGYMYPISGHPAADASATLTVTLAMPIEVALTTSSRVTLVPNPHRGVIQTPASTLTGVAVGAAVYPIPATEFGWVQTGGPAGVLIGGTPGPGTRVVVPGDTAGEVIAEAETTPTVGVVGSMMVTGVDGKVLPVYLTID